MSRSPNQASYDVASAVGFGAFGLCSPCHDRPRPKGHVSPPPGTIAPAEVVDPEKAKGKKNPTATDEESTEIPADEAKTGITEIDQQQLDDLKDKVDNINRDHLTEEDLDAARRERKGEVVKEKDTGVPFDHVDKVENAMTGLQDVIDSARGKLSHPGLSQETRDAFQDVLSEASKSLDRAREGSHGGFSNHDGGRR